mmetsp:Transcript_24993/g.54348  ORF Transcript_24993/g.54348 Transcript_24993/m.54348 type:complete len:246 (-) Transcript_24993:26-763(-)
MASQGAGLLGDTLHHAAITQDAVGVVIDDGRSIRLVEASSQVSLSDSQTHSIANTLAQGTCGDLNAASHEVLGVAWGLGAPLTELLDIVERDAVISSQVQHSVLEHRAVASGQHEAIPVHPLRVLGIVPHDLVPQNVAHRGAAHRHAWMTRLGLVHTVNGQEADGVHALVNHLLGQGGGSHSLSLSKQAGTALGGNLSSDGADHSTREGLARGHTARGLLTHHGLLHLAGCDHNATTGQGFKKAK